ncbi:MAG: RNase H-like domain-containing protein [Pseudomonadota bacterium]|nr:RNase H-like domain-containing protein [Pseudomonadota bacterium]
MELSRIEPLNLQSSPADIISWLDRFDIWCNLQKGYKSEQLSAVFLTVGGKEVYDLLKDLAFPDTPVKLPLETLQTMLKNHIVPKNFSMTERAKFDNMTRGPNVPYREFVRQLQRQAAQCDFGETLQERLLDRLIAGINDIDLQRAIIERPAVTFNTAREICTQREDLHAATTQRSSVLFQRRNFKPVRNTNAPDNRPHRPNASQSHPKRQADKCLSCGQLHPRSTCRFRNAKCHACGKNGHIRAVCQRTKCNFTEADPVTEENSSPIYTLQTTVPNQQFIHKELVFQSGASHPFIVDTGSSESIIPVTVLHAIDSNATVQSTNVRIHGVTGHKLKLLGQVNLPVQQRDKSYVSVRFLVAAHSPSILGLHALRQLDKQVTLATTTTVEAKTTALRRLVDQCSQNTGGMRVPAVHLQADGEPIFLKRRIIPYGQRDGVQQSLNKMETSGIITKIESSAWATPIVVAMKSDGQTPRLCGDYRLTLNPRLRRCSSTTMEPEDFMKMLLGCTVFSKIDLADAYLQIPLAPESRHLTTINTPWGLYQYNYLPFGLHVSSGIFQAAIDDVLQGIHGVLAYQDDVIIAGKTKEEHDRHLMALLQRLAERNVAIRPTKCVFASTELQFLGFNVSSKGYRPDPQRYHALIDIASPSNPAQLRSVLGCLQYYSRFIPNFATKAQPLFVAQSAEEWTWSEECEICMRDLINTITKRPCLEPFSPTRPTTLVTDASEVGIGAVLEQEGHPVICISRLLNKAESGYSQTQKEALAVFWAVRRLHKYLFGIRFTVITDHQALKFLFDPNKSIAKPTAAMLQRWSISLAAYDYDIQHRPGKEIPQADFLSRYSNFEKPDSYSFVTTALPISREELRLQTRKQYPAILSSLSKGWTPDSRKRFAKYYIHREELSIQPDGVICRADRILIPPTLRKAVLDDLHKGHMGAEKMKSLARQMCWWPEMDNDIRSTVRECQSCLHKLHHRPRNWTPWPASYAPWQRIHLDFCGPFLHNQYALVVIDSYSKWPEVFLTDSPTTAFTMQVLRKLFSREGIPQVLITDNGSQFCAIEMKKWLDSIGCRHLRTAPRHPCSNGAAENLVKTIKSAIASAKPRTAYELDTFVDNFLLQYRNAVHATTKETPSRLFKGRNLRCSLRCLDSTDIRYFRGNDLRPSRGIVTGSIGKSMVEVTDLDDATTHQRHIDQIQFREARSSSQTDSDIVTLELPDDEPQEDEQTTVINIDQDPEGTRRPARRASQVDEASLREGSCGDYNSSHFPATKRCTFQCLNDT